MPTGKETAKGEIEVKLALNTIQPFTDLINSEVSQEDQVAKIRVNKLFPKML